MSDKIDILDMLEHGDILIRRADNGYVVHSIGSNTSKSSDPDSQDDVCYGGLNPEALSSEVLEVDPDDDSKVEKDKVMGLLYVVLNALGIYQSKHNEYSVDINVVKKRKD